MPNLSIPAPLNFKIEVDLGNDTILQQNSLGQAWINPKPSYDSDQLVVRHKNIQFLQDQRFLEAYRLGQNSGHKIMGGGDLHIEWRVHVCIWAAKHALNLKGDFVECGVNTGMYSLAIMKYFDFDKVGKKFFLFDTFCGVNKDQMSPAELAQRQNEAYYFECYELAKSNFAPWQSSRLVRGSVPDTLSSVDIDQISYLSIDMNVVAPEIAAGTYFWDKLVTGGVIVLDDYGWKSHEEQQQAWDAFAADRNTSVLLLPTGQGLILKP